MSMAEMSARWMLASFLAVACVADAATDTKGGAYATTPVSDGDTGQPIGEAALRQRYTPKQLKKLIAKEDPMMVLVTDEPRCSIEVYSLDYRTVGGRGEAAKARTTVMLPSGDDVITCGGTRPVVLAAHGTSTDRNYDTADFGGDIDDLNEGLNAAAFFASQGYIVVMPNYAGYAGSDLPYAPYLNAEQQSRDMMDALRAARVAFPQVAMGSGSSVGVGGLYLTGYSQGGYVAMATLRAMQSRPWEFRPRGLAAGSGPYALSSLIDRQFLGAPSAGATVLASLIVHGWQSSYGNIYQQPTDLVESRYASSTALLPGTVSQDDMFAQGLLPIAMFSSASLPPPDLSNPNTAIVNQAGFSPDNFLVKTAYRDAFLADLAAHPCSDPKTGDRMPGCQPANGLRADALRNDLRDFTPKAPVQMCGAHSDALVYFSNTLLAKRYFNQQGVPDQQVAVIDVDRGKSPPPGPYASLQKGFALARALKAAEYGNSPEGQLKLAIDIHDIAAPFCMRAAREFFDRRP
jgi:alpha-beta hydrolase superfamily lysophospholipase